MMNQKASMLLMLIRWYMFEASFSLMFAKSSIDKDDISYVCGHCFRSISSLNQVLFALNNEYCINEKNDRYF